jgi:NAD(P)-dependent dehydrogenase (short-subunit alcohol dehydrogenase family)
LALTIEHLERGDFVYATCRKPDEAKALQSLQGKNSQKLALLPLDVTSERSIQAAAQTVQQQSGALDVLYNNAAILHPEASIDNVTFEVLAESQLINASAPVIVAKGFYPLLTNGRSARLVNISSESGSLARMTSYRGYSYYGSKAALNMYTRALAWDARLRGVIVVAIHPGWVRTDMGGRAAHLSPEESAQAVIKVVDRLIPGDSGKFFTYRGEEYPW